MVLNAGTDREQVLPSKFPYRKAAAGRAAAADRALEGGCGDPAERDPAAVRDDVVDGYVTAGGCPGLGRAVKSPSDPPRDQPDTGDSPTLRRWLALLLIVAMAADLAACGNDDDEGAATTAAARADIEHAQSQLDAFSAEPQFEAPGPAVDAAAAAGKSVAIVPASSNVPS